MRARNWRLALVGFSCLMAFSSFASSEEKKSPLDLLKAENIPLEERFEGQPDGLVAVLGSNRGRQWGYTRCATYSPDGKRLVSAGMDGYIRVWDAADLRSIASVKAQDKNVCLLRLAADGKSLVSCGAEGTIFVWDAVGNTFRLRGRASALDSGTHQFSVAPDGRTAASACGAHLQVWDLSGAAPRSTATIARRHFSGGGVAISADGRRVAYGGDGKIHVYDVKGGSVEQVLPLDGHSDDFHVLAFLGDGSRLASATWHDEICLWDLRAGKRVATLSPRCDSTSPFCANKDGAELATADSDMKVQVWDLSRPAPRERLTFQGVSSLCAGVLAFSPDGSALVTAGDESLHLWGLRGKEARELVRRGGHSQRLAGIAFSPDGYWLLTQGYDDTARVWELGAGTPTEKLLLRTDGGPGLNVSFSPDGRHVAFADGSDVRVGEVSRGAKAGHTALQGHAESVNAVAYSADGSLLASGDYDGTVRVWGRSGKSVVLPVGRPGHVKSVAFADGILAAGGGPWESGWVTVWRHEGGAFRHYRARDINEAGVLSIAMTPDGRTIALACDDGTVRLVEVLTGGQCAKSEGHEGHVNSVSFGRRGRILASSGDDGRVILWDALGKKLKEGQMPGPVYSVAISPEGRHLATGNANGTAYILRLPN